jgi:hypothetical protein
MANRREIVATADRKRGPIDRKPRFQRLPPPCNDIVVSKALAHNKAKLAPPRPNRLHSHDGPAA